MEERHPAIINALVRERDAPFTDDTRQNDGVNLETILLRAVFHSVAFA